MRSPKLNDLPEPPKGKIGWPWTEESTPLQHLTPAEQNQPEQTGHQMIFQTAKKMNIPIVQLGPEFKASMDQGQWPYRDIIHPNELGQWILAKVMTREVENAIATPTTAAATRAINAAMEH